MSRLSNALWFLRWTCQCKNGNHGSRGKQGIILFLAWGETCVILPGVQAVESAILFQGLFLICHAFKALICLETCFS
jgi:hypothetical protein